MNLKNFRQLQFIPKLTLFREPGTNAVKTVKTNNCRRITISIFVSCCDLAFAYLFNFIEEPKRCVRLVSISLLSLLLLSSSAAWLPG